MRKEDYIKCSFFKVFKSNFGTTNMLFRVHKGFETKEDLTNLLLTKGYDLDYVVIVKFLNMYYGVIFEDYDRNYIIGKLKTYYVSDKYIHVACNTETFKPKFYPTFIKEQIYKHQTLAYDLKMQDANIDVFVKDTSIAEYEYANTYIVILALTFIDYYFSKHEMYILNEYYFSQDYSNTLNNKVIGINPFKGKVMLSNGAIRNHQFYEKQMSYYNRGFYYNKYFSTRTTCEILFTEKVFYTTIDEDCIYENPVILTVDERVNNMNSKSNVIYLSDYRN